jgi:hypothetical protein
LDGQYTELFLSGLQDIDQRAKKFIELHGECIEYIPGLIAVACFIPGRAKDLSAPPRTSGFEIFNSFSTEMYRKYYLICSFEYVLLSTSQTQQCRPQ